MVKTRTFVVPDSLFGDELAKLADAKVKVVPISKLVADLEERSARYALQAERRQLKEFGVSSRDIRLVMKLRRLD